MAKKKAPARKLSKPDGVDGSTCFIVTPIGDENSEVRRATDGLIDAVIEPVLKGMGIGVDVAHRSYDPKSITRRIVEQIVESRLVIANLTGLNPNVMYELAVRHASAKPVVVIAERGTRLPFDIKDELTFFYSDDMQGVVDLRRVLSVAVQRSLEVEQVDNPVIRYTQSSLLETGGETPDAMQVLLNRLDLLESRWSRFESAPVHSSSYRTYANKCRAERYEILGVQYDDLMNRHKSVAIGLQHYGVVELVVLSHSKHGILIQVGVPEDISDDEASEILFEVLLDCQLYPKAVSHGQ